MTYESGTLEPTAVRGMFDRIAPVYDVMNRVMTAGLDQRWRRLAVTEVVWPGDRVLDAADFVIQLHHTCRSNRCRLNRLERCEARLHVKFEFPVQREPRDRNVRSRHDGYARAMQSANNFRQISEGDTHLWPGFGRRTLLINLFE